MISASHLLGIGAAFGTKSDGLKGQSHRSAQRLLSKRKQASGAEHGLRELKSHQLGSSPESEAIWLAQRGDAGAFESIYQQHCRRVYALCLRMLRDPIEAEDLVQDVFLLLFRKIHTFRGQSAFSTWLHRLTVNVVLMRLRKKSPPMVSFEATVASDEETSAPSIDIGVRDLLLEGSIDRMNLERCIGQLPAGYRTVFVLHDIQGYQHKEIAGILGLSEGHSKSQLHKARRRLRGLLHRVARYGVPRNDRTGGHSLTLAPSH